MKATCSIKMLRDVDSSKLWHCHRVAKFQFDTGLCVVPEFMYFYSMRGKWEKILETFFLELIAKLWCILSHFVLNIYVQHFHISYLWVMRISTCRKYKITNCGFVCMSYIKSCFCTKLVEFSIYLPITLAWPFQI